MIIDTNIIAENIKCELAYQIDDLIQDRIEQYIMDHEETWFNIQERVKKEILESILNKDKHDLWMAFQECVRDLNTVKRNINNDALNEKVDMLSANMDALYAELQALKNDLSRST